MKNQVQLITYIDRLGEKDIVYLTELLKDPFRGLFGGVHLLPFFYPIDGEDAGFDPIDHNQVDPTLGNWNDIKRLSQEVDVMADLIVNHISADSSAFQDVLEKGVDSPFYELFLTYDRVFPNGATEEELLAIYRPRPGFPFSSIMLQNGSKKLFWTTFTQKQIDIDVNHFQGRSYLSSILNTFQDAGIKMIRIDAAGYAIKTPGTSCFMTPDTFEFIGSLTKEAQNLGIEVLVEIHSYYQKQIDIAKKVDWVYDFALPPLILHTLFQQNSQDLIKWLKISPRNALTVLDTHDGIGIVDIGSGSQPGEEKGLVLPHLIDQLVETIHEKSNGTSRKATGEAASNLDLYQVNCTYYEALGKDDNQYLIARMIQFFAPGIPQVYYMGLLAGENDMELLAKTGVGRDINRHYYSGEEIDQQLENPVVQRLMQLIRFRNQYPAFQGTFSILDTPSHQINLRWEVEPKWTELFIDLQNSTYSISFGSGSEKREVSDLFQLPDLKKMES
ncbi:UNVERIFIED_CONTAM: hypothetical protein GTU68_035481 [Idotea baltica]|nr:hypothetical protein [Idotea baltica]